jgi:hypothetical protein
MPIMAGAVGTGNFVVTAIAATVVALIAAFVLLLALVPFVG